jgi:K+-sensing histidine kinase KdpD
MVAGPHVTHAGNTLQVPDQTISVDNLPQTISIDMGPGLAISRSIVKAHGGQIWAAPNQPRGAVFRFTLLAPRDVHSAE